MSAHPPSTRSTAFDCPHCGAYTSQRWYDAGLKFVGGDDPQIPTIPDQEIADKNLPNIEDIETRESLRVWIEKVEKGRPFRDEGSAMSHSFAPFMNCFYSECYNCKEWAIWVHERMVYPRVGFSVEPHEDMPAEVRDAFLEASVILEDSPRGAAAMLRLAIQHLCVELGKPGRNIDADIASLVQDGLDPVVQQSLDIVRVVGNEAVHPGTIDLRDNKEIAIQLFSLVNLICDQRISTPRKVADLYAKLPQNKRDAIAQRDSKGSKGS